ncbi:hypothetical protein AGMMS49579_22940 [Spirochaetia bacterium]|nr:hypothetical protein AGMMS49579_22940 [Spirochaetia bacterium]
MSVPKSKRKLSDMEYYHTAVKLQEDLTRYLLRDFGIRDKIRIATDGQGNECSTFESFPYWFIERRRNNILNLSDCLV